MLTKSQNSVALSHILLILRPATNDVVEVAGTGRKASAEEG
jgi:hypothetical protein